MDVSENLQVVFLWDIVAVSQARNDNMQHPAAAVMAIIIVIVQKKLITLKRQKQQEAFTINTHTHTYTFAPASTKTEPGGLPETIRLVSNRSRCNYNPLPVFPKNGQV